MDYKKQTVKELKSICKEMKLKCYSHLNKPQLIVLIETTSNKKENIDQKIIEDSESIDYSKSEEKIDEFVDLYYKKIEQYAIKLVQDNLAFSPKIFDITHCFISEIKSFLIEKSKSSSLNANSLNNSLSTILNLIHNKVLKNNHSIPDNRLMEGFETFSYGAKSGFKDILKERITTTNINLNQRQNNVLYAKVSPLIKWCEETLKNLSNKVIDWKKMSIALMIVTGRRQSEIMATASFKIVDKYHLHFLGQTKGNEYDFNGYIIPCLVDSQLVLNGMQWLEHFGKRETIDYVNSNREDIKKATKQSHNRFSRYLNEEIKNILPEYVIAEDEKFWTIEQTNGKEKNRSTTHFCRQIYSQVAYQLFYYNKKIARKKHQILADILGHSANDGNARKASQNYDADIEITDYDELTKIICC